MRSEMLSQILTDLSGSSADIEASAVISTDGLLIESLLPEGMNKDMAGAMSAAILSLGERTAEELARGSLEQVLIQGNGGYTIITPAGSEALVTVLVKSAAQLKAISLDTLRAAEQTKKLL